MKRPIALACCLLVFASTAAAEDAATDPDSSPSTESSKSEKTSAELRITLISPSGRWGKVDARSDRVTTHAERSLYYGPGLGTRVSIKQAHHGLLAEFDYRLDTDIDSINSDSAWKTDFVLGRVGVDLGPKIQSLDPANR